MLLGDPDPSFPIAAVEKSAPLSPASPTSDKNAPGTINANPRPSFNGCLDVLHAASAALIDGTWEILIDSDFENVMKVLTSWIPIRDEDLLMRVAKAEWKANRKRK